MTDEQTAVPERGSYMPIMINGRRGDDSVRAATHAAEYVAKKLSDYGIRLGRFPRIRYVEEEGSEYINGPDTSVVAGVRSQAGVKSTSVANIYSFFGRHGLEVSQEAAVELCRRRAERWELHEKSQVTDDDDIVLFRGFRRLGRDTPYSGIEYSSRVLRVMAHEMWHVVERDAGILESNKLLTEGTAEVAALLLTGIGQTSYGFSDPTEDFLRMRVPRMVSGQLRLKWNPLKAMLKPGFRKRADRKAKRDLLSIGIPTPDYINIEAEEETFRSPDFFMLISRPSRGHLLSYYKYIGAERLASELEKQDVSGLLDAYKEARQPWMGCEWVKRGNRWVPDHSTMPSRRAPRPEPL